MLVGAIIGLRAGFSVPNEVEEETTHIAYDLKGSFEHTAFGPGAASPEDPANYYRKIINRVDVSYKYRFLPGKPLSDTREELTVTGLIECADWEKRIDLAQDSGRGEELAVSFRLDTRAIFGIVDTITDELGTSRCSPLVTIEAAVHTVAETDTGPLEEDFIQTAGVRLGGTSLTWDRDLEMSRTGYSRDIEYRQEGGFDYAISLKPNSLYGAVTLRAETPKASPRLEPVKSGPPYAVDIVERIDVSFDFRFDSEPVVANPVHQVVVTATVGQPEGRNERFVLVPEHSETGNFTSDFSLNMPLYYAVIEAIERESGPLGTPPQVLVTARVRTTAQSEHGPISEIFTQDLVVGLGREQILWPETVDAESSGAITETTTVGNPDAGTAKTGALGVMGIALVAFGFTVWNYRESRRRRLTAVETDMLEIRRKRREDLVVHVERLPDTANWETVVELGSLSELLKASDALLKPIMHCPEPERHTYCIIDGPVRYVYVSRAEEPLPDPVTPEPARSDFV